jgi:hypothetical protein
LIVAVPFATGCSKNPFDPDDDPGGNQLPDNTPPNDTPQNTLLRFEATYEYQVVGEYEKLFTKDFRFTFSAQSDPELDEEYGTSWGKDDEIESTRHLFLGFTDDEGVFQAAATSIDMTIPFAQELEDPEHPDSLEFYRLMSVPRLLLHITLSDDRGFDVDAPHNFYLIRGDIAAARQVLDTNQEGTASRWYIYRWDDLSPPLSTGAPSPIRPASTGSLGAGESRTLNGFTPTSWGAAKATYHR